MFRIGILGAENSHAMIFTEIFNGLKPEFNDEFSDMRVVAVGGNYPEANRAVFEKGKLEFIADKPEDMLGKVDAIMVTARDGRFHAPFVRPFIEAGLPAFIDKPFTSDWVEAQQLVQLAQKNNVPLVGGSAVKLCEGVNKLRKVVTDNPNKILGGDILAPVSMVNDYGNFWFYSAHLVESCLSIFGFNPQWVWASRHECGVTAVVHYPGFEVTNHFNEGAYYYSATVCDQKSEHREILDISDIFVLECRSFAKILRTGKMDFSYEQLIKPVQVLAAIEQSYITGEKISLE